MKKGFTLIELLVVIAIIGLLASIILVSLSSAQSKGRDAQRIANLRSIQLALETYYNDHGEYPCSIYSNPSSPNCSAFVGTYLATTPTDPSYPSVTQTTCASAPTTAGCYYYSPLYPTSGGSTASCSYYHLGAVLEVSGNPALSQDAINFYVSNYKGNCQGATPSGPSNTTSAPFPGNSYSGGASTGVSTADCITNGSTPALCYNLTPGS